jgi:hypothetical protein
MTRLYGGGPPSQQLLGGSGFRTFGVVIPVSSRIAVIVGLAVGGAAACATGPKSPVSPSAPARTLRARIAIDAGSARVEIGWDGWMDAALRRYRARVDGAIGEGVRLPLPRPFPYEVYGKDGVVFIHYEPGGTWWRVEPETRCTCDPMAEALLLLARSEGARLPEDIRHLIGHVLESLGPGDSEGSPGWRTHEARVSGGGSAEGMEAFWKGRGVFGGREVSLEWSVRLGPVGSAQAEDPKRLPQ